MGKKADRIAALEAEVARLRKALDDTRHDRDRLRREVLALHRPPSLTDRVRDEIADRVGWLRDAMGLGL